MHIIYSTEVLGQNNVHTPTIKKTQDKMQKISMRQVVTLISYSRISPPHQSCKKDRR